MTLAHDGSAAPIERAPGFPSTLLALVDRDAPDDGVSYVGSLLERALSELAPRTRTITVFPDVEGGADASLAQRTMFTVKLLTAGRALDCVLYNHLGVATAHTTLPARLRSPYAVFIHGAEAWGTDLEPERTRALRDAVVRIANSAHTARRVHEVHPDSAPAEVCPLALLPDRDTSPVDGALVSSITERTIVIAGRMNARERYKGHDELLEAWPTVLRRRTDARLVIIGRGDDVKRLQAKANGLGLAGSVRFTGLVTESTLDAMLARACAFALPSRAEGFGLSYLRAMRAGLPCIAGADDAAREVVQDGVTGMLVQPAERDALAQALIDVLGDTVRRRTMGEAGRARFEEHFTYERFRERFDVVMRRAFAPGSPEAVSG
jgi:phosphatidylinositol alpha-1,6-mannosyltransferase